MFWKAARSRSAVSRARFDRIIMARMLPGMHGVTKLKRICRRPCSSPRSRRSLRDVARPKSNLHVIRLRRKNNAASRRRVGRPLGRRSDRFAAAHLFVPTVSCVTEWKQSLSKFKEDIPKRDCHVIYVFAAFSFPFNPTMEEAAVAFEICRLSINKNLKIVFSVWKY